MSAVGLLTDTYTTTLTINSNDSDEPKIDVPLSLTVMDTPSSTAGDCNADNVVDAGDISALVLEIFDGDGNEPIDTPSGTFVGNTVGCNGNQDATIDAGDISCTVLLIFNGSGACSTGSP